MTKGFFKCCRCAHQWETQGKSFNTTCPKCGCEKADCVIGGSKPGWYKPSDRERKS